MGATAAAALVALAIVADDQATLRAAPHESATRQTMLTQGDWLEVRGEQQGYLHVYDHRHERPGYIRPAQVRRVTVDEPSATSLHAVVDYLRDSPGQESLGIGYVAFYLKAAPLQAIGADIFDALGTLAGRLAARASASRSKAGDARLAEQLQVAESYGVHFVSFEADGTTRICYDGDAWKRVLALGGSAPMRVRAAIGLTDPRCVDPALGSTAALELATERATVLGAVEASAVAEGVLASDRSRMRAQAAIVHADLAYHAARGGSFSAASVGAVSAKRALALVDRAALADDDQPLYDEAAVRTAGVRWASTPSPGATERVEVTIAAAEPGQTCVRVKARGAIGAPFEHCTYGVVWPSSVRVGPSGSVVTLAVSSAPTWSELRVFKKTGDAWEVSTVPPALVDPDVGYVELAGFAPAGDSLLVVREYRASGPLGAPHTLAPWMTRTFQVLAAGDLHVQREARSLAGLPASQRWETADWKKDTLALR